MLCTPAISDIAVLQNLQLEILDAESPRNRDYSMTACFDSAFFSSGIGLIKLISVAQECDDTSSL